VRRPGTGFEPIASGRAGFGAAHSRMAPAGRIRELGLIFSNALFIGLLVVP
jgi:hypothetical protein